MKSFRFESPEILWVSLVALLFIAVAYFLISKRYKVIVTYFGNQFKKSFSVKRVSICALGVAALLICFALARPQGGLTRTKVKSLGVETVILVDVSQSMMAQDIKPSRLDFIKNEISYILDSGVINRASLIAFAGSSVTLSPLTSDLSAIKVELDSLSIDSVGLQGTNMTSALQRADDSFLNGGLTNSDDSSVTKILLLFSDGEDNEPGAVDIARKLVKDNVSVFTIAIGTEKGAAIPIINRYGQQAGYLKNKKSETVITKLKPDFLKKIAKETKGRFYHFSYGHNGANQLIEHLKNEESKQNTTSAKVTYTEYFQFLLIMSFVLLLAVYWKGFLVIGFVVVTLSSESTWAFSISNYSGFKEATEALKSENYIKASDIYLKILISNPENKQARLNLALTYDLLKEHKKADQEYTYLESLNSLGFEGCFNYANSLAVQEKTDEALVYYQKALSYSPNSKEVKANIELLMLNQQKQDSDKESEQDKKSQQDQESQSDQEGQPDKESQPDKEGQPDSNPSEKGKEKEGADSDKESEKPSDSEQKEAGEKPKDGKEADGPKSGLEQGAKSNSQPGELSKEDINQILEEINRQEQKIRAKDQMTGKGKGQSLEKSW